MTFDGGNLAAAKMQDRNQLTTAKLTHYPTGSSQGLCWNALTQDTPPVMGTQVYQKCWACRSFRSLLAFYYICLFFFRPIPLSTIFTKMHVEKIFRWMLEGFSSHIYHKKEHFTQWDCKVNSNDSKKAMFRETFRRVWKEQCTYEVPLHRKRKASRGIHTRPFCSLEDECPQKTHLWKGGGMKIAALPCRDPSRMHPTSLQTSPWHQDPPSIGSKSKQHSSSSHTIAPFQHHHHTIRGERKSNQMQLCCLTEQHQKTFDRLLTSPPRDKRRMQAHVEQKKKKGNEVPTSQISLSSMHITFLCRPWARKKGSTQ